MLRSLSSRDDLYHPNKALQVGYRIVTRIVLVSKYKAALRLLRLLRFVKFVL